MKNKVIFSPVQKDKYPQYEMGIRFDTVYEIKNEQGIQIGIIYLSDIDEDNVYIEWIEFMTPFRSKGYLRSTFKTLYELTGGKTIKFECEERLLKKYLRIGCTQVGNDDCTENYKMKYEG